MSGLENGPFAPFASLFNPPKPPTRWERFKDFLFSFAFIGVLFALLLGACVGWYVIISYFFQ